MNIFRNLSEKGKAAIVRKYDKDGKVHYIPVSIQHISYYSKKKDKVREILVEYRNHQRESFTNPNDYQVIFNNPGGKPDLIEFEKDFDLAEVKRILSESPGVVVVDDPSSQQYPMPMNAHERDEVFVGRIRRDETQPNTLNLWIVSDNLRKGAATNAVQIAEYLDAKGLLRREQVSEKVEA